MNLLHFLLLQQTMEQSQFTGLIFTLAFLSFKRYCISFLLVFDIFFSLVFTLYYEFLQIASYTLP